MSKRIIAAVLCCLLLLTLMAPALALAAQNGSDRAASRYQKDREKEDRQRHRLMDRVYQLFWRFFQKILDLTDRSAEKIQELSDKVVEDTQALVRRFRR